MWVFLMTLTWVLFIFMTIVSYGSYYFSTKLAVGGFSQILYTLQNSMEGSESTWKEVVTDYFVRQWPWLIVGTLLYVFFVWYYLQRKKGDSHVQLWSINLPILKLKSLKAGTVSILAAILLLNGLAGYQFYKILGIEEYQKSLTESSDLFDTYYADPRTTKIRFPGKKKNLIYILCESMEQTYTGKENGGGVEKSLIPELTKLAKENNDFSVDDTELNGARTPGNTTWTIAGISAQTMGIPLNLENATQVWNRDFEEDSQFLPHMTALGDILKANGYNNYFLCGSNAAFAGRANLFRQHGDYQIFDYNTAITDKIIDPDHYVWWGYEDEYLFKYAQKELTEIAKEDEPFNFMMLTVDTHFPNGYLCEKCPSIYDTQYKNVIRCSDTQVSNFVKWIQQQDFYKDTTIVIAGDHLSMDADVPNWIPEGFNRKTFFTVINGPEYPMEVTREYATIDIYPTIIESLGATIDGGRLGLGTSLYSNQQTLLERFGYEKLNREMNAKSDFYESVILNGDQSALPEEPKEAESEEEKENEPAETQAVVTITPQEYEQNREYFADPGYVWSPPVTYPEYTEPPTPSPVIPEPSPNPVTPGDNTSTETPPSSGDNTGTDSGDTGQSPDSGNSGEGGTTVPETPPSGGNNPDVNTSPETPPAGGDIPDSDSQVGKPANGQSS
ncbi:sulfatase-like hydrolase/transferase [Faecalibaculum rodentium]|uniref:sulfatase-like hydrolase/transferase n=2 Tax=Faecalibaculum rodentium TaxID=1702221 RepID=UPI0023F22A02|nr:sulfatase-like hydrolase/transferase [Faecalibaculum rodentium]